MQRKSKKLKIKPVINFEDSPIRRIWDASNEKWVFAVIDVVATLTASPRARKYWNALKTKLKQEGNELSQKLGQLKMVAEDGKQRLTDVADTEVVLRIIQSIPSPKAEPFKLWLAKVGYERLQETVDPQLAIDRARGYWQRAGRSEKWIEQRMRGQEVRNKLTDHWSSSGVKEGLEYATLEAELIFTALAELSTTQIAKGAKAGGYDENAQSAKKGGRIAGDARQALEDQSGKKVITTKDFLKKTISISKTKI